MKPCGWPIHGPAVKLVHGWPPAGRIAVGAGWGLGYFVSQCNVSFIPSTYACSAVSASIGICSFVSVVFCFSIMFRCSTLASPKFPEKTNGPSPRQPPPACIHACTRPTIVHACASVMRKRFCFRFHFHPKRFRFRCFCFWHFRF
jgi:hypothetical protein